jgi:acylpyruvate hydrolase
MTYSTVRIDGGTAAARIDDETLVLLEASDVGGLLQRGIDRVAERGRSIPRANADLAPVVVSPRKIICIGKNYVTHIEEMRPGHPLPGFPTLFTKWADTLVGPVDDTAIPEPSPRSRGSAHGSITSWRSTRAVRHDTH